MSVKIAYLHNYFSNPSQLLTGAPLSILHYPIITSCLYSPHLLIQEMISTPDFAGKFDFMTYQKYSMDSQHQFDDFTFGNC